MKRHGPETRGVAIVLAIAVLTAWAWPGATFAADNTATGDINGVGGDLTDSNTFTINSSTLALVKTAFLTDGTQLGTGDSVPKGTNVRFLIYLDNPTGVPVTNVNVSDTLVGGAGGFAYVANSIKVDNSVGTGGTEAAIYAAVNATAALTDANDGDVAGISGAVVTAGSTGGNAQLDIAASAVWALLFEVTVQ